MISMGNKFKIRLTEMFIQLSMGISTIILQPPIPLLAIPFLVIITTRTVCVMMEDSPKP